MVLLDDGRVLRIAEPFVDEPIASDIFDPATNTWSTTQLQRNSKVRDRAVVVTDEGWVHTSGGMGEGLERGISARCDLLKPKTGEWIEMPPLPVPSYQHAAVVAHGRVHAIGGKTSAPRFTRQLDTSSFAAWAPGDTEWTTLPETLFIVSSPNAVALANGDIIVWGHAIIEHALRWLGDAWLAIEPIDHGAAVLPIDDGFVAFGGERARSEHARVRSFGARTFSDLPAARRHARPVVLRDGRIALIGGVRSQVRMVPSPIGGHVNKPTELAERSLFVWDGKTWNELPSPPLYGRDAFVLPDGRVFVHDVSMTAIWTPA